MEQGAKALVFDNGSGISKAGFAGDELPRAVFPSIVGRPRWSGVTVDSGQNTSFVGDEAQAKRGILNLRHPIERGTVTNWDDMELLWQHTFNNELKVVPEDHPILLTNQMTPSSEREKTVQIMFETFNVPSMSLVNPALLSIFACAPKPSSPWYPVWPPTGLVVDSGYGSTVIVPIADGFLMRHAIIRLDVGGSDITEELCRILREKGYNFTTQYEKQIVREMKEKLCYVALNFYDHFNSVSVEKTYECPDGQKVNIGNQMFRAPELLFEKKEGMPHGLISAIRTSVEKSNIGPSAMYGNIVLCGGSTMFPGFAERIQAELTYGSYCPKITAHPQRQYSTWQGGSYLATFADFKKSWISKKEYKEAGPAIVHKKCII